MGEEYTITGLSELLGLKYYQIIYRERVGRFPKSRRNRLNERTYNDTEVAKLREIVSNE